MLLCLRNGFLITLTHALGTMNHRTISFVQYYYFAPLGIVKELSREIYVEDYKNRLHLFNETRIVGDNWMINVLKR